MKPLLARQLPLHAWSMLRPGLSLTTPTAGKMVNFVQHPIAEKFPATVAPFQVFGNTCRDKFPATLFRFPLRTQSQAAVSKISTEVRLETSFIYRAYFCWQDLLQTAYGGAFDNAGCHPRDHAETSGKP